MILDCLQHILSLTLIKKATEWAWKIASMTRPCRLQRPCVVANPPSTSWELWETLLLVKVRAHLESEFQNWNWKWMKETHTICRQNIMFIKKGALMVNGFDIKMMVKINASEIVLKSLCPLRNWSGQLIQPNFTQRGPDWLCLLVDRSLTLFLPAQGWINPYTVITWHRPVGIGLKDLCI